VVTVISVPARTLLAVCGYSLPFRLRTTGGRAAAPPRPPPRPPGAPRPAAAAGAGAPGPAPAPTQPGPEAHGPPNLGGAAAPPNVRRPMSPLHTAAFHSGLIWQACSSVAMLSKTPSWIRM